MRPNLISKLLAAKRERGDAILDLTESNPVYAGLNYPADAIAAAFATPKILRYDPNPAGLPATREAICASYHPAPTVDQLLLTASTSEAYQFLFKLLTDPDDEVLVPRPSYPLFEFLAGMERVHVVPYPLVYHGRWRIDLDALASRVTSRTRALVLVNPNNPTGSFVHADELEALVALCRDRGLAIISDEVFAEYGFGEDASRVTSLRHVDDVLTFCLSGLSKSAGLPQMKLGWMVVNGPETARAEALSRLELIADVYLSVGGPVQAAAPELLRAGAGIRGQIRSRTESNLAHLRGRLGPESPFRLLAVEGGWYATLQVPRIYSEEEWVVRLLEDKNVLVQPGFFYDFESEAFLVLSLLTPPAVFAAGIEHLIGTVRI